MLQKQTITFCIALCLCVASWAQQDVLSGDIYVRPEVQDKTIVGEVTYTYITGNDSLRLDAHNMIFSKVHVNGKKTAYAYDTRFLRIPPMGAVGDTLELSISYRVQPKQTVYFVGWEEEAQTRNPRLPQIWTQGQGKYTSHWVPSFDRMSEKVVFDLSIAFDAKYTVVANGKLKQVEEKDSYKIWHFDMQKPMSSYLLAFAIGDYGVQELTSKSGIPIRNYFTKVDSLKVEPTYRHTQAIFDFLETEIGVPYPWQNYKQLPVHDFLYAGMENTGATLFSDRYMVDSVAFNDENYVNVNAHEMAHQWFGNLVTEVGAKDHWLHEGFATYYAYLAQDAILGKRFLTWKLYETARQLREGKGQALLDPKASSLTFYEKGAWALFALRESLGDVHFKRGIKKFLTEYAYTNVTVAQFMTVMETVTGQSLTDFKSIWLKNESFPYQVAMELLAKRNSEIQSLLNWNQNKSKDTVSGIASLPKVWKKATTPLKKELTQAYFPQMEVDLQTLALQDDDLQVRKTALSHLKEFQLEFNPIVENMLTEKSYAIREMALFALWSHFPENRLDYLKKVTTGTVFESGSLRLGWLVLALMTEGISPDKQREYYLELTQYTGSAYPFEIRLQTFYYLHNLKGWQDRNLFDLLQACTHPVWRFREQSRELLKALAQQPEMAPRLQILSSRLTEKERKIVEPYLKKE
ncbi:M1 family metallopeptidase [Sediminicola luteus]|uniref:M1 family metallopeptidase n=1 Tax=Sediminicola luteus TaxID=319238 RepID=UPI001555A447|nr:M1 family metallopeptidase [Sediminicola luteus]